MPSKQNSVSAFYPCGELFLAAQPHFHSGLAHCSDQELGGSLSHTWPGSCSPGSSPDPQPMTAVQIEDPTLRVLGAPPATPGGAVLQLAGSPSGTT